MEGEADAAHLPLCLERERRLIGAAALVLFKVVAILCVHEIEVEVFHAAGLELAFKEGTDILLFVEVIGREFIRKDVIFSRITRGQRRFQGGFTLAFKIPVRRVEIVEPGGEEGIHHLGELFHVHFLPLYGQAHTAEAEILFDFGIEDDFFHGCSLYRGYLLTSPARFRSA